MKPYSCNIFFVLLIIFYIISSSFSLSAQMPTSSFSFQYWDSLYSKALQDNRDSTDHVVKMLFDWTSNNASFQGESYLKYMLANEFLHYGIWDKAARFNNEAQTICQNKKGEALDRSCANILQRTYFLQAKLNQEKGNLHQAIFQYRRLINSSIDKIDHQRIQCEIGLGEIFLSQGVYLIAYQHFELAYNLILDHKLGVNLAARVLLESSFLMSEAGLDSLATANLKIASDIANQTKNSQLKIDVLCTQGHNHFIAKRNNACKEAYEEAIVLAKNNNQLTALATAKMGLGQVAIKNADIDNAKLLFGEAIELAQLLGQKEILAKNQIYLGRIHLKNNNLDSAYQLCNQAYETASIANLLKTRMISCDCLTQIHASKKEWQSAFQMQEEEDRLKKELGKNSLPLELNTLRFKADLNRLKKQQELKNKQLENQKSWSDKLVSLQWSRIYIISTLLGVSLLFLLILYWLFRAKKQHNIELQMLNYQLNSSNNLLEESIEELNQTNDTLLQTNQALNNFATIAAHDLKGPLRSINNFTQLLQRSIKNKIKDKEKDYFTFINNSARKLTTLIDDLLAFSRLGKKMPPPVSVDLNNVVTDIIASFPQVIEAKDAQFDLNKLPIVLANYSLMMQIFQNLICNSLKFAAENKKCKIKINAFPLKTNRIQIVIEDNGIGIPEDQQEQVFELFTRLNAQEKYEGSGVGLATCRKIVQHYGGKMMINSTEGEGTAVFFDLPINPQKEDILHVIAIDES